MHRAGGGLACLCDTVTMDTCWLTGPLLRPVCHPAALSRGQTTSYGLALLICPSQLSLCTKHQSLHPKRSNLTLFSPQLKANLLRTTLAKQSLEGEKKELLRKLEEGQQQGEQREDEARRSSLSSVHYTEELAVARDAIANLRVSFSEADPNQHILDTLEQCVSVIVEKLVGLHLDLIPLYLN